MEMEFSLDLFVYALEKNVENSQFEMWKVQFNDAMQISREDFISFIEYKETLKTKRIEKATEISYEEIEKEMELVEKAFERKEVIQNGII